MKSYNLALFLVLTLIFCGLSSVPVSAFQATATLEEVRVGMYPNLIRVVLDIDGPATFNYITSESELNINLLNVDRGQSVGDLLSVNDWVVQNIETKSSTDGVSVKIPLSYPVAYKVYPLASPSRIVVDFDRTFTQIKKAATISNGVDYFYVIKGDGDDYVTAQLLDVDPAKADIFPALGRPSKSFLSSVASFLTPWAKEKKPGFYKSRVSDIVKEYNALAGVNGTYFDIKTSNPLGILMIDGRLVSYPISDRTALVVTKDKKHYVDNIMLDSYFEINGVKYTITGVNEPRASQSDIILYTPDYGELTKTNASGIDLVVEDGKIKSTRSGNTWIPENGFVLSAGALYAENLAGTVQIGDQTKIVINVIPYSTSIHGELLHLVGGGPRLLKSGRIYISKYEEKFRRDISRGRAARTAIGITDKGHLMFVTVDGRARGKKKKNGSRSLGMSLTELAYFMQSLGVQDALNLDGGGSTTMSIYGNVMNHPVDGAQRSVSNAILIK
ncbi:phosphodiester glycosidase family protein [Candidatus Saganbacteria bacterium]|nr:phosphodiester glycosidase family protein [Candidatus Saganbacteria bacterium]